MDWHLVTVVASCEVQDIRSAMQTFLDLGALCSFRILFGGSLVMATTCLLN